MWNDLINRLFLGGILRLETGVITVHKSGLVNL